MFTIRPADTSDATFIADMLVEAAGWDPARQRIPREELFANPDISHYVDGWPRDGDISVVAETIEGTRIGSAWCRQFSSTDPGYGFIDAATPEVSIGVVAEWRGRGVGGALLDELARAARDRDIRALSLSVERTNPARVLYERHGYTVVGESGALTMRLDLAARP